MRLELNKTRLTIAVLAIALGATTLSGMLKPSTDEGEALSPRVATPLKSANAIPSVDNSNATNAVVEAVIVEPVAEINPKSEAQKRAISLNERDYTSEFFDAKSDRVQTDDFGNHFVDVPQSSQTMKRYLISNWPLYSPTPQEQQDGTVEGCMSLNYYVGMEANITLVVEEGKQFRMHHYVCEYDYVTQNYQLTRLSRPPYDMMDSIQAVVNQIMDSTAS